MAQKYDKWSVIGAGAFGKVWRVIDRSTKEVFAIKEVAKSGPNKKDQEKALSEVSILKKCHHANVIRYIDAFLHNNCIHIVMEYADGGDLNARIAKQHKEHFPEPVILEWFVQICFAFRYIHGLNIIHRDLKTHNIFLSGKNQIKVGDFGISRALTGSQDIAMTLVGTPHYLSPEICRNKPYNQKSDMWALGCVLYELCCLKCPFTGASLVIIAQKITAGAYTPIPSQYSTVLRRLISGLLRQEAENRLAADEILRMIELRPYAKVLVNDIAEKKTRPMSQSPPTGPPKKNKVSQAIGIDLGTTNSCVAVLEHGKVEIIANDFGSRTTPSYVAFTQNERLIGQPAKNQTTMNAKDTVFNIKRLIGRQFSESVVENDIKKWPFKVISERGNPKVEVEYKREKQSFFPQEISAMVLTKMKETAEAYLGNEVQDAVITVPAYFNDSQRQATKDAGRISGLNVLCILNESTAAAIAYGLDKKIDEARTILIFDLGGGTFDVSIVTIENGFFEVKSTAGDTHLGGEDVDNRIVEHFAQEFMQKHKKDITGNKRAMYRLHLECERAKHLLSGSTSTNIHVDSLFEGIDFQSKLSRSRFDDLCHDLFHATMEPVEKALKDAHLSKSQIDDVVLVGGSTRIVKIQKLLQEFFDGKDLNKNINADEAVAYGAAIEAARLHGDMSESVNDILLLNVTPLSLGVEVSGGRMSTLIKRNTTIPTKQIMTYSTSRDNQDVANIVVYEGEHPMTCNNHLLGMFEITGIRPALRGQPKIEVDFEIDKNGLTTVSARDKSTGNWANLIITNRDHLTKEEIDRMVADAAKYRAEDKVEGSRILAKDKLEELAFKVKSAFKEVENMSESSKNVVVEKCNDIITRIDFNQAASEDEYQYMKEQLLQTAMRIATEQELQELYKRISSL